MALKKCKECGSEVSTKAVACPKCGAKQPKQAKWHHYIIGIFVLLFFVGKMNSDHIGTSSLAVPSAPSPKEAAIAAMTIDTHWSKGGFGSVMEATFKIANKSSYAIKDIKVTCEHYAPSGTRIDSNTQTIYERLDAGKTRTFRNVNMGFIHSQAQSTHCSVEDVTLL